MVQQHRTAQRSSTGGGDRRGSCVPPSLVVGGIACIAAPLVLVLVLLVLLFVHPIGCNAIHEASLVGEVVVVISSPHTITTARWSRGALIRSVVAVLYGFVGVVVFHGTHIPSIQAIKAFHKQRIPFYYFGLVLLLLLLRRHCLAGTSCSDDFYF
jgi:hypothetical protein